MGRSILVLRSCSCTNRSVSGFSFSANYAVHVSWYRDWEKSPLSIVPKMTGKKALPWGTWLILCCTFYWKFVEIGVMTAKSQKWTKHVNLSTKCVIVSMVLSTPPLSCFPFSPRVNIVPKLTFFLVFSILILKFISRLHVPPSLSFKSMAIDGLHKDLFLPWAKRYNQY